MDDKKNEDLTNQDNIFQTQDISTAAYLITLGFNLVILDNSNPKKCIFCFCRTEALEITLNTFWTSQEKKFFDNLKTLKTRIHQS